MKSIASNISFKNIFYFSFIAILFLLLSWRGYREIIPAGASPEPFLFASIYKQELITDSGNVVYVYYNDAGAAHSGNHWTWVVHWNIITGKKVVLEGFSGPKIIHKELQNVWVDGNVIKAIFLNGRYERENTVEKDYSFTE